MLFFHRGKHWPPPAPEVVKRVNRRVMGSRKRYSSRVSMWGPITAWAEGWLLDCKARGLSPNAIGFYRDAVRAMVKVLGDKPMGDLSADDLRAILGPQIREVKSPGGGSPSAGGPGGGGPGVLRQGARLPALAFGLLAAQGNAPPLAFFVGPAYMSQAWARERGVSLAKQGPLPWGTGGGRIAKRGGLETTHPLGFRKPLGELIEVQAQRLKAALLGRERYTPFYLRTR
jgi:hypothetical protein